MHCLDGPGTVVPTAFFPHFATEVRNFFVNLLVSSGIETIRCPASHFSECK
jgi:hypothetical protein